MSSGDSPFDPWNPLNIFHHQEPTEKPSPGKSSFTSWDRIMKLRLFLFFLGRKTLRCTEFRHCLGEMRVLNNPEKPCFAGFCFPMTWQTVTNVLWGRTMRINVVCQFVSLKDRHKIDRRPTSFSKPKMATKCEVDYLGKWKIEPDLWWLLWSQNPRCLKFRTCRCNSWKALSCLWMTPAIYLFEIK